MTGSIPHLTVAGATLQGTFKFSHEQARRFTRHHGPHQVTLKLLLNGNHQGDNHDGERPSTFTSLAYVMMNLMLNLMPNVVFNLVLCRCALPRTKPVRNPKGCP